MENFAKWTTKSEPFELITNLDVSIRYGDSIFTKTDYLTGVFFDLELARKLLIVNQGVNFQIFRRLFAVRKSMQGISI